MVLAVMVFLIVNNGGSVADVIGGDDRSDGRVKNCCHDNKMASRLDRLFFFQSCLLQPQDSLNAGVSVFFFRVLVLKWGHGPRRS